MTWFRDRTELVLAVLLFGSLVLVTPRIAESDAVEYFSYLPSILFDYDVSFEDEYRHFYDEDPEGRQGFKETFLDRSTPTGLKLNFGPMGTAVLWSPFYIATHVGVVVFGALGADVEADGMSQPYRTAVSLASAFYGALGALSELSTGAPVCRTVHVLHRRCCSLVGDASGVLHVHRSGDEPRGVALCRRRFLQSRAVGGGVS